MKNNHGVSDLRGLGLERKSVFLFNIRSLLRAASKRGCGTSVCGGRRAFRVACIGLICFAGAVSCASPQPRVATQIDVQELPPGKIPGVNRYCWEQPKVVKEANGPGLTPDGAYYQPAYTAVREVKQGRWKNCETGEPVKLK